jgi:hypothetical protein
LKLLIKALVKVTQNANTSSRIVSDVISGKGGGLVSPKSTLQQAWSAPAYV